MREFEIIVFDSRFLFHHNQVQLFIFILLVVHNSSGVLLNNAADMEQYLRKLIKEFEEKPRDFKFSSVIYPSLSSDVSSSSDYFFPKVLIWSPQEHFGIQMNCPFTTQTCFLLSGPILFQERKIMMPDLYMTFTGILF